MPSKRLETKAGVVLQRVGPLPVMSPFHTVTGLTHSDPAPANAFSKAVNDDLIAWGPDTQVGCLGGAPGSWLQPSRPGQVPCTHLGSESAD